MALVCQLFTYSSSVENVTTTNTLLRITIPYTTYAHTCTQHTPSRPPATHIFESGHSKNIPFFHKENIKYTQIAHRRGTVQMFFQQSTTAVAFFLVCSPAYHPYIYPISHSLSIINKFFCCL